MRRRGKIVNTIGPASGSYEKLLALAKAGMDVARINRSHGTPEQQLAVIRNVRRAAQETGRNIGLMVDLQGPKIRCGWFRRDADGNDEVILKAGDSFRITTDDIVGDEHATTCTYKDLPADCKPGDTIMMNDGKVHLRVVRVDGHDVYTTVVSGGPVSSHKGINLPGVDVSAPALTQKDEEDLRWGLRAGADMIAMSFVRQASDIDRAHEIMDEEGRRVPIIVKVEKPEAVENMESIVKAFDGIMSARGDLAVEMPYWKVPLINKQLITMSRRYAKPVIVATDVLASMVENPIPTRAEASDCANAILDGADATMTSNETAVGVDPAGVVRTMCHISEYASSEGLHYIPKLERFDAGNGGGCAHAAVVLAEEIGAKAIVTFTENGVSANQVASFRSEIPLYAFTSEEHNYHWLALTWGTEAFLCDKPAAECTRGELLRLVDGELLAAGKVQAGERIVVTITEPGDLLEGAEIIVDHVVLP
ncbi:MAG: pyruvate kinase [Aeriscardovia sp.]|nr:pyruvate kinase [Aeriscardovia sp.]